MNLAVNAKHAMLQGGELRFIARLADDDAGLSAVSPCVRIDVEDTGKGIPAQQMPRTFEPFYTTKSAGQGTGLGLAMVYGTVSQHGGKVEVVSEVGHGARFRLYLPQAEADDEERVVSQVMPARRQAKGLLIYVVEDEPTVLRTITRVLPSAGYLLRTFPRALDLVAVLDEVEPPDLVLSDAVMPEMSGYDLLEKVRTHWPEVAALVMSGYTEDERLKAAISKGSNFISKPFTPIELIEAIDRAIETERGVARSEQI